VVGVAHRYATGQALAAAAFSGGERTVVARLSALGFDVRDVSAVSRAPDRGTLGEIPGAEEGTAFADRGQAADRGVHRARQAGIVGTGRTGAESIVVSGGYEDDEDYGRLIIYTGHGGRNDSGRQAADQSFDSPGNAALVTSMLTGSPVRVIRGPAKGSLHAPTTGYRYDGVFRVESAWRERGRSGFLVCRYRLVHLDDAAHDPISEAELDPESPGVSVPDGAQTPGRRPVHTQRIVRSTEVADYVKALHDHTCQACGLRLSIGGRGYSEAAHIRALGRPRCGPDIPANVLCLCLCPNCHVLFDNGALVVLPDLTVRLNGEPSGAVQLHPSHPVDSQHLAYHRSLHP